jgi:hypothetical protein
MAEALKAAVQIAAYVAPLEPLTLWVPVAANPGYLLVFREEERQILQMLGLISSLRRWAFDTPPPKEWWTPIRHAHKKPMCGVNRFSLSPHGQAIRRSPLLGKSTHSARTFAERSGYRCRPSLIGTQGAVLRDDNRDAF